MAKLVLMVAAVMVVAGCQKEIREVRSPSPGSGAVALAER